MSKHKTPKPKVRKRRGDAKHVKIARPLKNDGTWGCPDLLRPYIFALGMLNQDVHLSEYFSGAKVVGRHLEELLLMHCMTFEIEDHPSQNMVSPLGFLLALKLALCHNWSAMSWSGIVCASWGFPARSTSGRTKYRPWGWEGRKAVRDGNVMVHRMYLLWLVMVQRAVHLMREQPGATTMFSTPLSRAIRTFLKLVWAWVVMGAYGHRSPKPSRIMSNMKYIRHLSVPCTWTTGDGGERLCDKWWDTIECRWRCAGNSKMKSSQQYPERFGAKVAELYQQHKGDMPFVPGLREVNQFVAAQDWSRARLWEVDEYLARRAR